MSTLILFHFALSFNFYIWLLRNKRKYKQCEENNKSYTIYWKVIACIMYYTEKYKVTWLFHVPFNIRNDWTLPLQNCPACLCHIISSAFQHTVDSRLLCDKKTSKPQNKTKSPQHKIPEIKANCLFTLHWVELKNWILTKISKLPKQSKSFSLIAKLHTFFFNVENICNAKPATFQHRHLLLLKWSSKINFYLFKYDMLL